MATTFQRTATVRNYLNSQIVDSSYSSITLDKPEVGDSLVRPYGLGYLSSLVSMIGNKNIVQNPHYSHSEENRIRDVIVATATAGAAGAEVTFTVDASKRATNSNSAAPEYGTSGSTNVTMPQQNDVILVPNGSGGHVQCVVTSTTDSSYEFTATPKITGENIPTVTTAVEIAIIGTQFGESSSEPSAVNPTLTSYTNNTQIFRRKAKVSGSAMGNLTWFDNLGENENESYWFYEGVRTQKANLFNDRETSLLVGEATTNTTLTGTSGFGTTKSTSGLVPFIEANGQREQYTAGSLALTDIESMSKKLFKQRGSTENMMVGGHDLIFEFDNLIRTSEGLKAGGVQYAGMGGEKRAVDLGFDSINYGGITYHYKPLEVMTSPELLGATGLTYKNMGLVIPLGNVVASMDEFGNDRQNVPNLRINCLSDGKGGSREYVEVARNAMETDGNDEFVINLLSECGFEGFAGQRFGQFYV